MDGTRVTQRGWEALVVLLLSTSIPFQFNFPDAGAGDQRQIKDHPHSPPPVGGILPDFESSQKLCVDGAPAWRKETVRSCQWSWPVGILSWKQDGVMVIRRTTTMTIHTHDSGVHIQRETHLHTHTYKHADTNV